MTLDIVPLENAHLDRMGVPSTLERRSYFSLGSVAYCVLADGEPVFAGGIVQMQWNRGEAWILNTAWFRSHVKTCLKIMQKWLPSMASSYGFKRVQATCIEGTKSSLIRMMGFSYEGKLQKYGPNGEPCRMYARIFEEAK
jgi:hypothetical protein